MATAAVLIPIDTISQHGGVLPPSALVQHAPRHGRSRAASMKGKNGRTYNVIEGSDVAIRKAMAYALRRTVTESEAEDEEEESDNLVQDAEGWVSVAHLLEHPKLSELGASLADVRRIVAAMSKARFELSQASTTATAGSSAPHRIRILRAKRNSLQAPLEIEAEPITSETPDLPEFVVYETSYQAYPLILASGAIQRAAGAVQLAFVPMVSSEDASENRSSKADISIWVNLQEAMAANPAVTWQRTVSGTQAFTTTSEVPRSLWTKVVARRPDVGVLFENGEVRGEVPEALRRKGTKGSAKKTREGGAHSNDEEDDSTTSASE
ncbi:uncharacterized protein B0I36DRAFT_363249 [Microdochium trichocladiopsis]|uniref:2'-phosphotransferase n=1 Tax=Microdochium trichocladiopsis TaxID=1682393 RepID=A0A9P9BR51_9PEZI|nr:uncharacterized protein B0I36DRAFT_363249 [Microdochium trichocladiopsis]KAH7031577.1 hypothetical protein B0I36DRAFT_363249 [Microdochium trichocladiopsis]